MKKVILVLAFICIAVVFASCSLRFNREANLKAEASGASETAESAVTAQAPEAADASAQNTGTPSEKPTDSGLTLAAIKQAAESAGYETGDVDGPQMGDTIKAVDGFTLHYEDDNTSAYIPILEFKNSGDAEAYAKEVNESGYNLCIVNGKFLTMTSAQYGIATNDNETKVLETLLQSKVMTYTDANPGPLKPAKDYAGAYIQIDTLYNAVDKLVNKSILLHDKTVPEAERISAAYVSFYPLSSGDLSFTSTLSEDQAQLDAVVQVWEMFGAKDVKLNHAAANDYILTGTRMGLDTTFELHCSFDPKTGSLRLIDTDGGEVLEFYEFVPLGGDRYAFQTLYSRAIVGYKDGKVTSLIYSLNKMEKERAYSADKDGIFGKTTGIDEAWVTGAGADSFDQFITYDGTMLKLAADSFMGDRFKAEIKAQ